MTFAPGDRVGGYEILAPLGAGGMGEVYRAHDAKLRREVALKVLAAAFTADSDRLARLEREARVLASLNHPNIATIYGLEEIGTTRALVLELVDGDTLAARIAAGAVPLRESLDIARAIADALDTAHEKGVVHRDLKPANVMLTSAGAVKVLDFGLATTDQQLADLSRSPTMTDLGTREGIVLGTIAYMSPEQARGLALDKRTDIWSFGCVLYEMLTGRPAFAGPTFSDTVVRILEREPEWSALPLSTPATIRTLLRRCLAKPLKARARDIGDVRAALDDAGEAQPEPAPDAARRSDAREVLAWTIAAIAVVALGAALMLRSATTAPTATPIVTRTTIELPADQKLALSVAAYPLAISPDGVRIAYAGEMEGRAQLYLRELRDAEPRALPGTDGARQPFFSPDGQWIAFFTEAGLYKVAIAGGSPMRICNLPATSFGGSWGADGTIVFAVAGTGLFRVDARVGTPTTIAGSDAARWPQLLPDGKTILFTGAPRQVIGLMAIDGGSRRILAQTTLATGQGPAILGEGEVHSARYVPSGHIVYGQDPGFVRALPFDLASLTVTGTPASLADLVERAPAAGAVYYAVSDTGLLTYAPTGSRHQLVWVDRSGASTPITTDRDAFREPRLSPDGTRVAVAVNDRARRSDLWIYNAALGNKTRLTSEAHNLSPVWKSDGHVIAFYSGNGPSTHQIVALAAGNPGVRNILDAAAPFPRYPTSWSRDGQSMLVNVGAEVWVLSASGKNNARRLLGADASNHSNGKLSPDGRWLAYVSNESGRQEIYVAAYPALDRKTPISSAGGNFPAWSRDGRELFYRQGDAMMAVAVSTGRDLNPSPPRRLFAGPFTGVAQDSSFDVSPDAQRFVMIKSDDAATLRRLTLVHNWVNDLR